MVFLQLIFSVVIVGVIAFIVLVWKTEIEPHTTKGKVDNYPISRIDESAMMHDKIMNNLSDKQVQKNLAKGMYDKR